MQIFQFYRSYFYFFELNLKLMNFLFETCIKMLPSISKRIFFFTYKFLFNTFFVCSHCRFIGRTRFTRTSNSFTFCRQFADFVTAVLFLSYLCHFVRGSLSRPTNHREKRRESLCCVPHYSSKTVLFAWESIALQLVAFSVLGRRILNSN